MLAKELKGREIWRPRRRWKDNIKMDLKDQSVTRSTGCIWLRIGTSGDFL
jgi:hypothetical protein